jgi:hypothetical protein
LFAVFVSREVFAEAADAVACRAPVVFAVTLAVMVTDPAAFSTPRLQSTNWFVATHPDGEIVPSVTPEGS